MAKRTAASIVPKHFQDQLSQEYAGLSKNLALLAARQRILCVADTLLGELSYEEVLRAANGSYNIEIILETP